MKTRSSPNRTLHVHASMGFCTYMIIRLYVHMCPKVSAFRKFFWSCVCWFILFIGTEWKIVWQCVNDSDSNGLQCDNIYKVIFFIKYKHFSRFIVQILQHNLFFLLIDINVWVFFLYFAFSIFPNDNLISIKQQQKINDNFQLSYFLVYV